MSDAAEQNLSVSDLGSINIDVESVDGSPFMARVNWHGQWCFLCGFLKGCNTSKPFYLLFIGGEQAVILLAVQIESRKLTSSFIMNIIIYLIDFI